MGYYNIIDIGNETNKRLRKIEEQLCCKPEILSATGSLSSDTDVIAAVSSKSIRVLAFSITNTTATAVTLTFKSGGTSGTALWAEYLPATIGARVSQSIQYPAYLFETLAGQKLTADVNSGATLIYNISYILV